MNTEQASPFQQQLLALRAQVLAQLAAQRGGTVGRADVAAEHFGHPEDSRAQVNTERDIEFALGEHEIAHLAAIDAALERHPGLSKVQAKRREAAALHDAQEALRKPQVLGFGLSDIRTGGGKPNWVAGVAVRWTLWDSVDRDQLAASGQRKIEQAELTEQQARSDIALLVEKNWLAVEHARTQYLAQQAQEDLARELLRLREAGQREGTGTLLEWMDARVNLAKVQTERAQTAHQYIQALAALLQSTGQSDAFGRYMAEADIQIPSDAP
jgi:outer membrane protein TolC